MPAKRRAKSRKNQQEIVSLAETEDVAVEQHVAEEQHLAVEQSVEKSASAETDSSQKRRKKKTTTFTEEEKEEIIDFLIANPSLYSKRLAGFKLVDQKDELWERHAQKMETTVPDLRTWYNSMRTMLGRLKKRAKKSGEGGEVVTDMNATEQWVWSKFAFLRPHIETVEARNVASFSSARGILESSPMSPPPTSPAGSQAESQAGSQTGSQTGSQLQSRSDRVTSGELSKFNLFLPVTLCFVLAATNQGSTI